jgi:hypothetical protein
MTLQPFFRKAARLEYDEAAIWYESQKVGLGSEFVRRLRERCWSLVKRHNGVP